MDLTTTQTHRRVGSGRVKVEVDLTTPPPPSPSKKHALEHDLRSGLPKSKKVREAQDTTEAKTDEKQPLVHPTPQQRDLTLATLDRAEPAGIGYDETDRPSFVASRRFFARISKEDSELKSKVAAPYEYYNVELSATGLERLNTDTREEDQRIKIGSALISIAETRCQDVYTCGNIVRVEVETGNALINMEAFAVMLRYIRSFCIEQNIEHLAMAPVRRSCWFSGLLEPAGFKQCECQCLDKHAGVNLQLCMLLPTPQIVLPADAGADESRFGTRSVSHHPETHAPSAAPSVAPAAAPAAPAAAPPAAPAAETAREGLKADPRKHAPKGPSRGKQRRKNYCMFWLRTGECNYMQTGCKNLHEMPDRETREKIGIRRIPQWFKDSPEYENFLRKFDRSASGKSTNVQSDTETSSTALPSGQSSDREGSSRERWRRGIRFAETRPDPVRMGSFLVHFPREDPHQGSVASGTKGKTPRAEASATTGRRAPDIYRPPGARVSSGSELQALDKDPGARVSSGGGDLRAADKDSPKIKQEEPSEGKAGSGYM